jgi:predicted XRE-type DNA-binding protein
MESKQREAFSKVVMALLDAKNLSQRQVALELDTSPSNLNQRILAGSMRPGMIMQFNKLLGVDLLHLVNLHIQGESLSSIIQLALEPQTKSTSGGNTSPEMYEMILVQNKTITDLQMQIKDLITHLHKWIEHDMQKALQQQEIISLMKSYRPETNS